MTRHLHYRPRISLNDPAANLPGSLAHSVIGPRNIASTVIAEYGAQEYFSPDSSIRSILRYEPVETVLRALRDYCLRHHDWRTLSSLEISQRQINRNESYIDRALLKPASSSSVSIWSRHQQNHRDAGGANALEVDTDYGFHTAPQLNPWWMVNLLGLFQVNEVRIVNRPGLEWRFVRFRIEGSPDGREWTCHYEKINDLPVSSRLDDPWVGTFTRTFPARFLRITSLGADCLHLRRIQVFGYEAGR